MKITVIGLGYIGLPTATMFAKAGMDVSGYDINGKVLEALSRGEVIIKEPGLEGLVKEVVANNKLKGVTEIEKSDVFIICVPTPINEDKTANMKYVIEATELISQHVEKGNAVILESTSPPGTIENIIMPILNRTGLVLGEELYIAYSPERVLPGKILEELKQNDRIIGGINEKSSNIVKEIYDNFVEGNIYITDSKTAEMCKLMENAYRDVNIALANELAITCEDMGINVWEVIELSNKHPRVNIHQPGPGVGGHCLAIDPWFIINKQKKPGIIKNARIINDNMPLYVFDAIRDLLGNTPSKIAILGITYKPNIDDIRESPIIKLTELLLAKTKYEVCLHDPYVCETNAKLDHILTQTVEQAVLGADIMVLGVNHKEYENLDFQRIHGLMKGKYIYDTRNYINKKLAEKYGFKILLLGGGGNEKDFNNS